jgi:hypothetical protein
MLRNFKSLLLVGPLLLTACANSEYRAERDMCTATWMQKIPPRYVDEVYNKTYTRRVPTGQTQCVTTGTTTNCTQGMRDETFTLPAVRTVDANASQRDIQITACTKKACIARFGNAECKAE